MSNNTKRDLRHMTLDNGSVLYYASADTSIETPVGSIHVDAGTLVLLLSFADGVAIYDLDDLHRGAVRFRSGAQSFVLHPGMCLLGSQRPAVTFERINPAERIAYRHIKEHDGFKGQKFYTAEFHAASLLQFVLPLKQLVASKHPNARRLTQHLLKTTAAALQVQKNTSAFKQMRKPTLPNRVALGGN